MNRKRLEHLVTVLEGVREKRRPFNLGVWMGDGMNGAETTVGRKNECGTACCAFGYAALDPEFQRQGLVIEVNAYSGRALGSTKHIVASIAEFNELVCKDLSLDVSITLKGNKDLEGFDAAAKFFDLDLDDVHDLFDPAHYGDGVVYPRHVIERIQKLLARKPVKKRSKRSTHPEAVA